VVLFVALKVCMLCCAPSLACAPTELLLTWLCVCACSLWELLLNVVILSVAFFFFYEWMQTRGPRHRLSFPSASVLPHFGFVLSLALSGYWQAYVDPVAYKLRLFLSPVINALQPVYTSLIAPM
jgi:hypothetical protein